MTPTSRLAAITLFVFSFPLTLHATDPILDSAFVSTISPGITPDGYVPPPASPNWLSGTGAVNAVALQSDGKIIAGGNLSRYQAPPAGSPRSSLKRLNADGTLDTAFGTIASTLADSQGDTEVNKILTVAGDKLYIGGVFTSYDGAARSGVMRLNSNGTLDTSFNAAGISNSSAFGVRSVLALAEQPDGKLLVGGGFNRANGVFRPGLARFNPDGTLDTSFNPFPALPTDASAQDIAILPDGDIVVAGAKPRAGGGGTPLLVRLNSDGSLDYSLSPTFADEFGDIDEMIALPDGRIVIGGDFSFLPTGTSYNLACLLPDGTLDTAFMANLGSGPNGWAGGEVTLQPDGTIFVGGIFTTWNNQPRASIARLLPDGTLDAAFAPTPYVPTTTVGYSTHFYSFAFQPDGKLVVGGWFARLIDTAVESYNLSRFVNEYAPASPGTVRLVATSVSVGENQPSVTLQVSRYAGTTGTVTADFATLTGGADGTATAGLDFTHATGTLTWAPGESGMKSITVPLLTDSVTDGSKTFTVQLSNPTGGAFLPTPTTRATVTILDANALPAITTQPASVSLEQGARFSLFVRYDSVLASTVQWQLDPDGAGPQLYADISGATAPVYTVTTADAATHSGTYRAIITNANGITPSNAATVSISVPAGSLITAFLPPATTPIVLGAQGLSIDTAGRFLMLTNTGLRRLNADGTLDPTTSFGISVSGATCVLGLDDGKILIAGNLSIPYTHQPSGATSSVNTRIFRLNADATGTIDTSWSVSTNGIVTALAPGAGGKFYIGSGAAPTSTNGIQRFLATGATDSSFTPAVNTIAAGTGATVYAIRELSDGRILVSHRHGSTSTGTYRLSRLTSTGALDTTFGTGGSIDFGTSNWVNGLDVLPDGRIAVSARFNTDFFTPGQRYLAILNTDGTPDASFQFGSTVLNGNPNGLVYRNGRLFVWGSFTTVNGATQGGVVRLNLDGSIDNSFSAGVGIAGGAASVNAARFTSTGEIFIAGGFTSYKGVARNYSALLVGNPQIGAIGFVPPRITTLEENSPLTLTLRRFGASTEAVSVSYSTEAGTATAAVDFTATSGSVFWAAGDTADKTISIQLLDNVDIHANRSFRVVLSSPVGPVSPAASATVTLIDDETPVTITTQPIASASFYETQSLALSVTATSPSALSYQWFRNGTAINGATSATYNVASVLGSQGGVYHVRVTNASGTYLSTPSIVTVRPQPGRPVAGQPVIGRPTFNGSPTGLVVANDGYVYVGGPFTASPAGNVPQSYLIRVKPDGTTDTSYTYTPGNSITAMARQPDGKILLAGSFTGRIIRLNADGTVDTDFTTALGSSIPAVVINDFAIDSLGRIYLGGASYLARLSSTGTLDATYTPAVNNTINTIAVQTDDKLIVAGFFTSLAGSSASRLGRLETNGTRDASYTGTLGTTSTPNDLLVLADGRVLLAMSGSSSTLAELSNTGAQISNIASTDQVYKIAQAPGGKILATRTSISGTSRIFRLLGTNPFPTPGSADTDTIFNIGTGPDADARMITVAPDGSVWIAGQFSSVNSVPTAGIAKLNGDPLNPAIVNPPVNTGLVPGGTAYLGVGAFGSNLTYQWFKNGNPLSNGGNISGATSAILTISNASTSDDDDYTVVVTGGSPASTVTSNPAHLYLLGAPIIATPPAAINVFAGPALSISAEVYAAAPATYQWSKNGIPVANDARVTGATTAALSFTTTTAADTGSYTLTITNAQGTASTSVYALVRPVPTDRAPAYSGLSSSQSVTALHALPDGGMLVANLGGTLTNNSVTTLTNRLQLVRSDGTVANLGLDPANSFVALPNLGVFTITTIFRQPDGKILLGGNVGGLGAVLFRILPDGTTDPAFSAPYGSTSTGSTIRSIVLDDAGRILIGGDFTNLGGISGQTLLARLDPATGALDTTFVSGFSSGSVTSILKLPGLNSGFIVGGVNIANPFTVYIRRYDASGANVTSFTGQSYTVNTLALSPDGTTFYAAIQSAPYLVRYRVSDGSLDPAFSVPTGTFNNQVNSLAVQPDGKIVAHGQFNIYPQTQVGRLLPNGAPDPNFLVGGTNTNNTYYPLALDTAGHVWIGGSFTNFNNATADRIAVLEGDVPSLAWSVQPYNRAAAANATISFTAQARATSPATYQWFRNGSPLAESARISGVNSTTLTITGATVGDEGLYTATATTVNPATSITSAPGEFVFLGAPEITLAPSGGTFEAGVSRTLSVFARGAGTLTYQWFKGSATAPVADIPGATSAAYTLAAPTTADTFYYGVRVTNTLGSVSSTPVLLTFANYAGAVSSTTASFNNTVNAVIPLADSSYVVAGNFTIITPVGGSATTRRGIARILANGAIDTAFSAVAAPTSSLNLSDIKRDGLGRYIVIGNFSSLTTSAANLARNSIARLDSTGAPDTVFTSPLTTAVATLNCVAVDSSNRVLIGGSFTNFGGTSGINYLVRLDATTGARDTAIVPDPTGGAVNAIHVLANGKILVGGNFGVKRLNDAHADNDSTFAYTGNFTSNNGNAVTAITPVPGSTDFIISGSAGGVQRITANGVVVTPWPSSGTAANSSITELLPLADGTYLVGGAFSSYNNVTANRIAPLNANGTLASALTFGTGFGGNVNTLALDASGRLFAGGAFTTYKGATANRLVILNSATIIPNDPGSPVTSDPLTDFLSNAGVPANLRGPNDDADNDGLDNLLEYALDLNPNGGGGSYTGTQPVYASAAGLLSYTYRRVRNDVTYVVETSPSLVGGTWTAVGITQGTPAGDGTTTASIPITPSSQFLRLSVTR